MKSYRWQREMESYVWQLEIGDEFYFNDDLSVLIDPGEVIVYVVGYDIAYVDFRLGPGEYIGMLDGKIIKFTRDSRFTPCDIVEIIDVLGRYGELAYYADEYRSNVESGYWSPYKGLETVMRRHRVSQSIAMTILGLN